ncbi:MAG: hypothetical protein ACI9OH_002328 [Oleispira sp.]|jgi:hypothetical protein
MCPGNQLMAIKIFFQNSKEGEQAYGINLLRSLIPCDKVSGLGISLGL